MNQHCPYPANEEEATAFNLERYLVERSLTVGATPWPEDSKDQAYRALVIVDGVGMALFLGALRRTAPTTADQVARYVWGHWEAGDSMGEELWERAVALGIPVDRATWPANWTEQPPATEYPAS